MQEPSEAQASSATLTPSYGVITAPEPKQTSSKRSRVEDPVADDSIFWANLRAKASFEKCRQDLPKLPWEQAPWSGKPFKSNLHQQSVGFSDALRSELPPPKPSALPRKAYPSFVVRRLRLDGMASEPNAVRLHCLQKLRTMIMLDPPQSELATSLVDAAGKLVSEDLISKSFQDAFAAKATATLIKRTAHLWDYASYVTKRNLGSP